MIGIILFLVGTSIALWICGAAICGIASAIVWPTSMALMLDGIPLEQSAQFLGYTSLSLCVGMFLGPVLGGLIYAYHGHNAVWALVLGVAAFDLVLRLLLVEPRTSQKGKILSEQALPPGEKTTGSRPLAFGLLLRSKRVLSALWAAFVQATVLTSFDGALVIHVTSVFEWDAGRASLLWIAIVLPSLATPLVGMMVDRFGGKYFGTVGFLVSAVCLVALRFVDSDSLGQKVLLCAMLALIGASLGTIIPVFSAEVNVVADELAKGSGEFGDRGIFAQAGAVWWATYTMGLAIGPLWGGLVRESAGWATMGWSLAILCAVTAVPVFRYTS
jgi:MFS family permease